MTFNSLEFMAFFAIVLILYYVIPKKFSNFFVLLSSVVFIGICDVKAAVFVTLYGVLVYFAGRIIDKHKSTLGILFTCFLFLVPLFLARFMKYILLVLNRIAMMLNAESEGVVLNLLLPIGVSYFTFKSVSYLVDVYKGKRKCETNVIDLLAFVTFFPEMLIGPIDRADNLLEQLKTERSKKWTDIEAGFLLLAYGIFEKMVIADRLSVIVDGVFNNIDDYRGLIVIVSAVAYSLQIYFEFAGCTNMALGIGRTFGFSLLQNFNQPYFAVSVADFWRRWHMSLNRWFVDYVYIPLGGSRKGEARKYLNVLIVFLVSGIWHGAEKHYIAWCLLAGIFQIIGSIMTPLRTKLYGLVHVNEKGKFARALKMVGTFILMTLAWIFFRAPSVGVGVSVIRNSLQGPGLEFFKDGNFRALGLNAANLWLLLIVLLVALVIDILKEKKVDILESLLSKPYIVKILVFYLLAFSIIIFGMYGSSFNASDFVYMNF